MNSARTMRADFREPDSSKTKTKRLQWFVTAKSEGGTDFQSVARIAKARTGSPFYEFAAPAN